MQMRGKEVRRCCHGPLKVSPFNCLISNDFAHLDSFKKLLAGKEKVRCYCLERACFASLLQHRLTSRTFHDDDFFHRLFS